MLKAAQQAAVEAKNQLPLVSVSRIYGFPLCGLSSLYDTFKADGEEVLQGPARSAVKPPKLLPFGTKMSLSLVFAPAEAVEEMAEALPVCLGGGTTLCHLANKECLSIFKESCCDAR